MNTSQITRRAILAGAAVAAFPYRERSSRGWEAEAKSILSRIRPPGFPNRDFDIREYGAVPDGAKDSTGAIRKAIDACSGAGGGRIVVTGGLFLTGAVHLKSNINLHIAQDATLRFSRSPGAYPLVLTRWEGVECMSFSPLVYAFEQTNIAITGKGVLDGWSDCEHWWPWKARAGCGSKNAPNQAKDRAALFEMGEKDVPVKERVFGMNHYLRPQFIEPYRSKNVLIEDVTIRDSPMWLIHPVLCENVTVRNVNVVSHGPNNDGCDPESCRDVLIQGCTFDTGDDCIAIKSGRNREGRRINVPCENLIVENCTMKDGHGGVSIGSEASGGVRNVFVRSCTMSSPNLERALRIKTNSYRGGVIENISFENVKVGQVSGEIAQIDFFYEEGEGGPFLPTVRHLAIRGVTSEKSNHVLYLRGYAKSPIQDVTVEDCTFKASAKPNVLENVQGLQVDNVTLNGQPMK